MTRVLIVEDEESFADPLAFLLRKEGFTTAIAASGQDALEEFDRNGADIRIEWATMEKGVESIRSIESPDLPTLMAADRQAALEYLRYTQGGGGRDAFPALPMRSATRE